jgi:hypothetical protein
VYVAWIFDRRLDRGGAALYAPEHASVVNQTPLVGKERVELAVPDDPVTALVRQSSISFTGTVEQLGASTLGAVPANDRTGIVLVDHVLHAPPTFAHLAGSRVTVQFAPGTDPPAPGQRVALFTNGLAFGDTIAVSEVGRLPVSEVEPRVPGFVANPAAAPMADIESQLAGEDLRSHAVAADAVIVGRVSSLEKAGPVARSEHDPDWWRATIDIQHVEKGNVPGKQVAVAFPNSRDVQWHATPKPVAGQGGVWLLHASQGAVQQIAPYTLADSDDFKPLQQLDVIRGEG